MSSGKALSSDFISMCRRMSTVTMLFHGAVAERLGLNQSDHKCADLVREHGPLTAGRLSELTGLTTGAITGVIDRLERAGFVAREADAYDRRKVLIRVVPESQKRMWPLFSGIAEATKRVCADYSDEQLMLAMEIMARLTDATQEQIQKLREQPADAFSEGSACATASEPDAPRVAEDSFEAAGKALHQAKRAAKKTPPAR